MTFSTSACDQQQEAGAGGDGGEDEQEERGGPDGEAFAEGEGPAAQDAVKPAERALVEEREQRADAGQHRHQHMEAIFEDQERGHLAQLAIAQQDRADIPAPAPTGNR